MGRKLLSLLERPRVRRVILTALALLAVFLIYRRGIRRGAMADYRGYVEVGDAALAGGHIYDDPRPGVNTWPPFFSLLCVPIALLDGVDGILTRVLWILLSYAALLWSLHLLARLVYDKPLSLRAEPERGLSLASAPMLVPLLMVHPAVMQNLIDIQIYILLFALTLSGMYWQSRGRPLLGGMALALAAAIRLMPVVFIPYLIYRRRWRPAAYAVLFLALFTLSPALVYGWDGLLEYLDSWRSMESTSITAGNKNQSVLAFFDRYLSHGVVIGLDTPSVHRPWILGPAVWAAAGVTLAAVTAGALWVFRGRMRADGLPAQAEWGVVFLVSAVFGPLTWKTYLIVFLAPFALLFGIWWNAAPGKRLSAGLLLFALFFAALLPAHDLTGPTVKVHFGMAGCYTITALALIFGLFVLRRRYRLPDRLEADLANARTPRRRDMPPDPGSARSGERHEQP